MLSIAPVYFAFTANHGSVSLYTGGADRNGAATSAVLGSPTPRQDRSMQTTTYAKNNEGGGAVARSRTPNRGRFVQNKKEQPSLKASQPLGENLCDSDYHQIQKGRASNRKFEQRTSAIVNAEK